MRFFLFALLAAVISLSACATYTETNRDPSQKGYILAEQMIADKRYHDGILMHRVNANFFEGYPYAQKSAERVQQLNEVLVESVKNRMPVEIIEAKTIAKPGQHLATLTIVNNTSKKIIAINIQIFVETKTGAPINSSITNRNFIQVNNPRPLGAWDIDIYRYPLPGFSGTLVLKPRISNAFDEENKPLAMRPIR